jgi:hypothetical protein
MAAQHNPSKQHGENKHRAWLMGAVLVICCAVIVLLFRSGEPRQKLGVQGKITLDGKPLDQALIVFIPISIEGARQSGSLVTNGKYQVDEQVGLVPGRYRVEFHPYLSLLDMGGSRTAKPMPQWYAVKPQLEIEVKASEMHYDFSLKTAGHPAAIQL